MPRRTLQIVVLAVIISFACYQRTAKNPYGRYFSEIISHIDHDYLDKVDEQKLFDNAVEGMIQANLDEHSGFVPRTRADDLRSDLDQEFAGIGIVLGVDPKTKALVVHSPIVGSPAYIGGIQARDKLLAIDGKSTAGMALDQARKLIKGPAGEPVRLEVEHPSGQKADIKLIRAMVRVDSVLGDTRLPNGQSDFMLPGQEGIGYIRITSFGEHTGEEMEAALKNISEHHARGLIIDLRDNPGGLLSTVNEVCQLFLTRGKVIVTTRDRSGKVRDTRTARATGPYHALPLVVLVNRDSASASEIMAACLQDNDRATIVGERTYGKGTVQNPIPTEGGKSFLRLTVASFWRPSGKNIRRSKENEKTDDWGVRPDPGLESQLSDEALEKWRMHRINRDVVQKEPAETLADLETVDPQLKKAVDELEKKLAPEESKSATEKNSVTN